MIISPWLDSHIYRFVLKQTQEQLTLISFDILQPNAFSFEVYLIHFEVLGMKRFESPWPRLPNMKPISGTSRPVMWCFKLVVGDNNNNNLFVLFPYNSSIKCYFGVSLVREASTVAIIISTIQPNSKMNTCLKASSKTTTFGLLAAMPEHIFQSLLWFEHISLRNGWQKCLIHHYRLAKS